MRAPSLHAKMLVVQGWTPALLTDNTAARRIDATCDGAAPETKEKGTLRRELLYVNFINSLRNRNPGAMHVGMPRVDESTCASRSGEGRGGKERRSRR